MKGFVTHRNEHLDEQVAMLLLIMYGSRIGMEFESHTLVRRVGDPKKVIEAEALAEGYVPLGVGGGMFDEHRRKFRDEMGRPIQESATSLVAKKLNLDHIPGVVAIVEWVRYADQTDDVLPEELSSLIKNWHLLYPSAQVRARVMRILQDLIRYHTGAERCGESQDKENLRGRSFTLTEVMDELQVELPKEFECRAVQRLSNIVKSKDLPGNVKRLRNLEIFRIFEIWKSLYSRAHGEHAKIKIWVKDILRDSVKLAVMYQEAWDKHEPNIGEFTTPNGITITVDIQTTDDPFFARVARNKGAVIVLIRSVSRRGVAILTNKKKQPHLNMKRVVARLRQVEYTQRNPRRRLPNSHNLRYWSGEEVPEVPFWYYHARGRMILNGSSQSSTGVEATVLSNKSIFRFICRYTRINTPAQVQGKLRVRASEHVRDVEATPARPAASPAASPIVARSFVNSPRFVA